MRIELGDKSFATGTTINVHFSKKMLQNSSQHNTGALDISCYVKDYIRNPPQFLRISQETPGKNVPNRKDTDQVKTWKQEKRGGTRWGEDVTVSRWQSQEQNKRQNFLFGFLLLAITKRSYRLKSVFPSNQLFLLQFKQISLVAF